MNTLPTPPTVTNAFARLMSEFRNGKSAVELSTEMQNAIASVKQTGKPATLRYTLAFTPNGGAIIVTDKIECKLPTQERDKAIFFATEDNTLSRTNPDQKEFELREVPSAPPEIRELPAARAV